MDVFCTHEGDLAVGVDGDLALVDGDAAILQAVSFVVKQAGGVLAPLVGELLTPETLLNGEDLLCEALLMCPSLYGVGYEVRGLPVNTTQALFLIDLELTTDVPHLVTIPFDFQAGVVDLRTEATLGLSPQV